MGCCMSFITAERRQNQHHQNHKKNQSLDKKSKTQVSKTSIPVQHPPQEVVETVKEIVLSESPNITKTLPKPPPITSTSSQQNHNHNQLTTSLQTQPPPPPKSSNTQEIKENTRVEKLQKHHHQVEEDELLVTPEVSQVSEIYSLTDSYSTATTVTEIREDEATSKRTCNGNHNVKNRASSSSSTRRRVHRERTVSSKSSPAGRERVPVSKRAVSGPIRSNVGPIGGGGVSGSSSSASRRSQATGRGRGGRNHSEKLTGRGGNRLRVVGGGDNEEKKGDVSRNNQQQELQREENDESLDNPLVSLECFIFL